MSLIEHDFVASQWESALPVLMDYIAIPARSPMFDPAWSDTGHIARAASLPAFACTASIRARRRSYVGSTTSSSMPPRSASAPPASARTRSMRSGSAPWARVSRASRSAGRSRSTR
mgnify:CR=1 FL=1